MGCTSSKVDDLPAVALCRERCHFLEEAIRLRFAFADAHVAYIHSLKEIGTSLHRVFDQDLDNSTFSPPSPVLPLPTRRKGDPVANVAAQPSAAVAADAPAPALARDSNSNSGSHIHFHSDSGEEDDNDSGSLHHSGHSSPLQHHYQPQQEDYSEYQLDQGAMGFPGGFMRMNYMRNRPTPSVTYEQRPMSPDVVRMDESSSSSAYYPYPNYPNQNQAPNPYYTYSNYGGYFPYASSSSSPPPPVAGMSSAASSSKPPPPPPSPPTNSTWDFLNPFETFERYYPPYTPSRDSKEVREEEGIPDLEDEDYQQEVVKQVHGDRKFVDAAAKKVVDDEVVGGNDDAEATHYQSRPSVSSVEKGVDYDANLVDKNVVINEERSEDQANVATYKARVRVRGASEVVEEIKIQFERAAESGSEISRMLEAGKLPYHKRNAVYQVSSKMLHVITPSLSVTAASQPSTSKSSEPSTSAEKSGPAYLGFDEDTVTRSLNLSSTLQKLYIWEKKLYDEVKAEEKMRVLHDRKRQRLKRLDEKGAEAHKVDTTRTLVRTLSTKIRIAIQVVDKISVTINKLRDEELWPQINELIHGLVRMWKLMLECHQNQCQAITETKNLDAIVSSRKFSSANLEAAMQLEHEVLNWISNFSNWVGAQKGYITALNSWLLKCIWYEPEETPDGVVPFSPGRMGAPPVFVICNHWSQTMQRISEKEVVDAMLAFALGLRQNIYLCRRMMTNGDMESKVKTLEREEQRMQKALQALDKKIVMVSVHGSGVLVPDQILHQSNMGTISSLQSGLKQIFDSMERFTANSMEAYEELRVRIEEDWIARENAKVP